MDVTATSSPTSSPQASIPVSDISGENTPNDPMSNLAKTLAPTASNVLAPVPAPVPAPIPVTTSPSIAVPVPPPVATPPPVPVATPPPLPPNREPAAPPKTKPPATCDHYDSFPARLACRLTHEAEAHPLSWAVGTLLLVLICYCRFCRRRTSDVNPRGEYRAIAASMTDEAFGDDYSFGENDEYLSDDEGDEEYGNGSIQMAALHKDGGLSLNELNG